MGRVDGRWETVDGKAKTGEAERKYEGRSGGASLCRKAFRLKAALLSAGYLFIAVYCTMLYT